MGYDAKEAKALLREYARGLLAEEAYIRAAGDDAPGWDELALTPEGQATQSYWLATVLPQPRGKQ